MRFYDEAAVRSALPYERLIPAMARALADFSAGRVIQPVRQVLTVEEGLRYFGVMPAVAGEWMGAKLVSFFPGNAGSAVPTHQATIALLRAETGEPVAIVDGESITEMRTAAVSAAVTDRLAAREAKSLALLGSGVQAHAHLEALRCVRNVTDVRVWSPTREHAECFARDCGARLCATAEEAVRGAEIVVTATSSPEPVLSGAWLSPGAHVNAVGACRPNWRELDDAAMHAGPLFVDSKAAAKLESGDVILSRATIYGEAGELFAGTVETPSPGTTTIFKSLGLAVEDIVAAALVAG